MFANRRKYVHTLCFGDTDLLTSVSSNTQSVGEEYEMEEAMHEEAMHDELGCDDNVEGVMQLDGMDVVAVENNANKISAITPEMIEKSVRHVCTAKAQGQYLHDCVADSCLDINNNASHIEKHYILSVIMHRILSFHFLVISNLRKHTT